MVSTGKVIQPRRNALLMFKYNVEFFKASLRKNIATTSFLVLVFFTFLVFSLKSTFHTVTVPSSTRESDSFAVLVCHIVAFSLLCVSLFAYCVLIPCWLAGPESHKASSAEQVRHT